MRKIRAAIFISGRGSNMRSLVAAAQKQDFPAEIVLVLSNRPEASGLDFAVQAGLKTVALDHKSFKTREAFDMAMQAVMRDNQIELICLAGFMRLLTTDFVNAWNGRMINIHPALLPNYKGLHTHERALADGAQQHGCTVHYVSPEMDEGPIILQRAVPILAGDTADTLAARVLEQEHIAYPQALFNVATQLLRAHPE